MTENNISFEKAFERLEDILEMMDGGGVPLEESLKLFEEANTLIKKCEHYLTTSEKKIETLIKDRSGELSLDEKEQPQTKPFIPPSSQVLSPTDGSI